MHIFRKAVNASYVLLFYMEVEMQDQNGQRIQAFREAHIWLAFLSSQQQYYGQLFGIKTLNAHNVAQALCLPVSIDELLQSHKNSVFT